MKWKRTIALGMSVLTVLSMTACGSSESKEEGKFHVGMITDTGGIHDQSFNQSAYEGLDQLSREEDINFSYVESKQNSDFVTNLDRLTDVGATFLWGIGFACSDAIEEAALMAPECHFAIVDSSYEDTKKNVTGLIFRSEESSFMVGYIAAKTTQSNKVGFVGGMSNPVIHQFEFGYKAGVAYAAKEMGKAIDVQSQYAGTFTDSAKGKAVAAKMIADGCDVVYHAAGGTGVGAIRAAEEAGKWAIGVDMDQAYLAPKTILTSSLKNVGEAVADVTKRYKEGEEIGGQTLVYGLDKGAVGIPENHENMPEGVYEAALEIGEKIKQGEIVPPADEAACNQYISALQTQ